MLKQFAILGLVLLIAGGIGLVRTLPYHSDWVALGFTPKATILADRSKSTTPIQVWPVNVPETPQDLNDNLVQLQGISQQTLKTQQQARLQADLDRLAGGEKIEHGLAMTMYGDDWQQQVAQYKSRKEQSEVILTGSFVLTLLGLIVFAWCVLVGLVRLTIRIVRFLAGKIAKLISEPKSASQDAPSQSAHDEDVVHVQESGRLRFGPLEGGRTKISVDVAASSSTDPVTYQRTYPDFEDRGSVAARPEKEETPVERLLSDEQSPTAATVDAVAPQEEKVAVIHAEVTPMIDPVGHDLVADGKPALAVQSEDLEHQLAQFKEMVQAVWSTSAEASEPFNKTLLNLNEQISAIRQYAAQQQQRVEKLQGGYDWNIIRTFCFKVIRCIDNLEDRIAKLSEQGGQTEHLDQVREELLFAMESSGVEQFEPQAHSVFRGQERWAEAIKDKEPCDDPKLKGCIAAVVKAGYQYVVDDQNVKVVRAARVKLYG